MSTAQPFHFQVHRLPVDWEVLKHVDTDNVVQRTDIDSLERVVHLLAHGDFDEQLNSYGIQGCRRVLRLCQLAIEYLLYVQGQLAEETSVLKHRGASNAGECEALRARVRELKARLALTQQELKRYRKTTKTYEFLACAGQAMLEHPAPPATLLASGSLPGSPGAPQPAQASHVATFSTAAASPQQLAVDLAAAQDDRETLRKQVEQLKREAKEAADEAAAASLSHRQEVEAVKGTVRRLQAQLERQESANRSHQSASREVSSIQASWRDSMAKQRKLEMEKDALELDLLSMRQQLEQLARPVAATRKLQQELATAHKEAAELQQALQQQQRRITAAVGPVDAARQAVQAEAAAEADALKRQVAVLQEQLRVAQQAATAANNEAGAGGAKDWRNIEIDRLMAELHKLQQEHRKVLLEQVAAKQQGAAASQDLARLQTRLAEVEAAAKRTPPTNSNVAPAASTLASTTSPPQVGGSGIAESIPGPQGAAPGSPAAAQPSLAPQAQQQQPPVTQQQQQPYAPLGAQGDWLQQQQQQQNTSGSPTWSPVSGAEEPKKKQSFLGKLTQGLGWKSKGKSNVDSTAIQQPAIATLYPTGQAAGQLPGQLLAQQPHQSNSPPANGPYPQQMPSGAVQQQQQVTGSMQANQGNPSLLSVADPTPLQALSTNTPPQSSLTAPQEAAPFSINGLLTSAPAATAAPATATPVPAAPEDGLVPSQSGPVPSGNMPQGPVAPPAPTDDFVIKADWGNMAPVTSIHMAQHSAANALASEGVTLGPSKEPLSSGAPDAAAAGTASSPVAATAAIEGNAAAAGNTAEGGINGKEAVKMTDANPFAGLDGPTSKGHFSGPGGDHGDAAALRPQEARQLKPIRSIIKQSSFTDGGPRTLMKSPSGRRVMFNLPDSDMGKGDTSDGSKPSSSSLKGDASKSPDSNVQYDAVKPPDSNVQYDDDGFPITYPNQLFNVTGGPTPVEPM